MKQTICLNMIVKNESAVIERCLQSVIPWIHHWVIIDTGSTDGTQEIIRRVLRDIPGELIERPWVDFAHNRNEALELARDQGNYLLFIDADEELKCEEGFQWPFLIQDAYMVPVEMSGIRNKRKLLVKNNLNWEWVGRVHEVLTSPEAREETTLSHVMIQAYPDGYRSKNPGKFFQDANILENAREKNAKNHFYLAYSYEACGDLLKALDHYQECSQGVEEEMLFYALTRIAWLKEILGRSFDEIVASYTKAFLFRPSRAEPLFSLAHFFVKQKMPFLGYLVSQYALGIPLPDDSIFVDMNIYRYRLLELFADCSLLLEKYDETQEAYLKLLALEDLPVEDRKKIKQLWPSVVRTE